MIKIKKKILVLGGNGFIGSAIVEHLSPLAEVVVATRKKSTSQHFRTLKMQTLLNTEAWLGVIKEFDVVINVVGILRERKNETYEQVHTQAVAALSQACAQLAVGLVHISALGLSNQAQSRFIRSKFAGEQAILASGASAVIVRAPLLDGEGGFGAKWFRRVASWPIQFVMQSQGLVAPLQVQDLGRAVANIAISRLLQTAQIVELGGLAEFTIPAYLNVLRASKGLKPAMQIHVPRSLVRLVSHLFDVLNWTPLSFGHFELMQGYNVPRDNTLLQWLGRAPIPLGFNAKEKQSEHKFGVYEKNSHNTV